MRAINAFIPCAFFAILLINGNVKFTESTISHTTCNVLEIINKSVLVDYTEMFPYIIDRSKIWYITAPPGFGKTCSLDMMKTFFELQITDDGDPITKADYTKEPVNDTSTYQIFVKKELDVTDPPHLPYLKQNFGKYPVISLNFHSFEPLKSYTDVVEHFKKIVHEAFIQHSYLLKSSQLSEEEKEKCREWIDDTSFKSHTKNDVVHDISLLPKYLYKHFNIEYVLLVDDFTSIVTSDLYHKNKTELKEMSRLSWEFFDEIVDVPFKQIFLTGYFYIKPFNKKILDKIFPYIFFLGEGEHCFDDCYGLDDFGFAKICNYYKTDYLLRTYYQKWYGGYVSFDLYSHAHSMVSVLSHIKNKKQECENYWPKTDLTKALKNAFNHSIFRNQLEKLLCGDWAKVRIYNETKIEDFSFIQLMKKAPHRLNSLHVENLCCLLSAYGYLTKIPPDRILADKRPKHMFLKIPNQEQFLEFHKYREHLFDETWLIYPGIVDECVETFDNFKFIDNEEGINNLTIFHKSFRSLINLVMDYRVGNFDKSFYQSILLHIGWKLGYQCKIDRSLPKKRTLDIVFHNRNRCIAFTVTLDNELDKDGLQNFIKKKGYFILYDRNLFFSNAKQYLFSEIRISESRDTQMYVLINNFNSTNVRKC